MPSRKKNLSFFLSRSITFGQEAVIGARIVSFGWNFGMDGWRNGVSLFDFSSAAKDLFNLRGLSGQFLNIWSGFLMVMSTLGRFS